MPCTSPPFSHAPLFQLILDAFDAVKRETAAGTQLAYDDRAAMTRRAVLPLETGDAIYFLLTLACSANIGSALTYTGSTCGVSQPAPTCSHCLSHVLCERFLSPLPPPPPCNLPRRARCSHNFYLAPLPASALPLASQTRRT